MSASSQNRHVFVMESIPKAPVEADPTWEDRHILRTRCPLCRTWRADVPYAPIHAALKQRPRTLIATTGLFEVVGRALVDMVLPYGRGIVLGTARIAKSGEVLDDRVTVYGTREDALEVDRGQYSRHDQCRTCDTIKRRNWWAHYVIVGRYLDERWLYLSKYDEMFVDARLIEKERLRELFPTLRFYPIPVVPEPLDGEVLPGDPGWTGKLLKTPLPKPLDTKPEKGIGLWL